MRLTSQQAEVVDEAVGLVLDGLDVFLAGYHLSGRSSLLQAVAGRLADQGARLVRIAATPGLNGSPLAALATSGIPLGADAGPGQAAAMLRERLGVNAVLVVDDADQLDPESLGVLRAVIPASGVPVISTGFPPVGGSGPGLTRSARVLAVPALRFADVHTLMRAQLGTPIDHTTVARIMVASGGLAGLVVAITAEARRTGRFHDSHAGWVMERDLYLPQLSGLIWSFLSDLAEEHTDAIAMLSVVRPLGLTESAAVITPAVVMELERRGLLRIIETRHGPVLSVFPPAVAETMRQELPPGRTMLLAERLADAVPSAGAGEDRSQRSGLPLWTVEERHAAAIVLSEQVSERRRLELGAARAEWERHPNATHAYHYLRALHDLGRDPRLVHDVINRTVAGEDELADALVLSWRATYLAYADHDLAAARAVLTDGQHRMPRYAGFLRAIEAFHIFAFDTVPSDDLLADPAIGEDPLSWEGLAVVRAQIRLAQGRVAQARQELESVTPTYLYFQLNHAVTSALCFIVEGDLEGGLSLASHQLDAGRTEFELSAISAHGYVAGLALFLSGRMQEFRSHFATLMSFPQLPLLQAPYLSGLLSFAVTDAISLGEVAFAESLKARSDTLAMGDGPLPGMSSSVVDLLVSPPSEESRGSRLWECARDRLARGYLVHGLALTLAAVDSDPEVDVAETLRSAMPEPQLPALALLARFAEALHQRDPAELTAIAGRFAEVRMPAYACLAHAAALRSWHAGGDLTGLSARAGEVSLYARDHSVDRAWVFGRLIAGLGLSAREWEVAGLVAAGHSNHDIAERLVVGVRTAEAHVQNLFRKLGVDNRLDLARAVRTWLRHPES